MKSLAKRPKGSLIKRSQPETEAVSIFKYIASQNRDEANTLLSKYSIRGGKTDKEVAYKLAVLVKKGGEDALKKIMELHPDKEYLTNQVVAEQVKAKEEKTLSACGCSLGADGYMNCCGSANADGTFSCEGTTCKCHLKETGQKPRPAPDSKMSAEGTAPAPAPVLPKEEMVLHKGMLAFTPTHTVILFSAVIISMALFFSRK